MLHSLKGEVKQVTLKRGDKQVIVYTKTIFLNGEELDPEPSQRIRNFYPNGFDWGDLSDGSSQLALAIVLKLTGDYSGFQKLKNEIINTLPKDCDFSITFNFNGSSSRSKVMRHAMAVNKFLNYEFLASKTDEQLLCFVHPNERTVLSEELGIPVKRGFYD